MARENPTWGRRRIQAELRFLGYDVAELTVSKYMRRRSPRPSPTWRRFLEAHLREIVAIDFFVVPSLPFRLLFAFIVSRIFSILIMLHKMPDVYLHVRGTHVHHLNYGIFLLAGVGAWLLFTPGPAAPAAAVIYGIGLGLTFDEFGMWLHLNGDYWQRASFDAVIVLAVALGLAGFAPPVNRWRPRQFATALLFLLLLVGTIRLAAKVQPRIQRWGAGVGGSVEESGGPREADQIRP